MSDTTARERITIYSDYVCPFCYLGRQSLDRYQDEREESLEIDWRPFDLRAGKRGPDGEIDHSVDDGKDDDYYQQARENVRRLRENYDAEMAQEIATDVDSRPAQAVSLHVKETEPYETWLAFDEAVFEALWADGRDIGDADVLADCAETAGLDPDLVSAALDDDVLLDRLDEQFRAAQQQGVTGVPTFAYGGHAARGAVPPAQLRRLVEGT
ncbi:DsbA family oxidoreductase [Haloplanus aerogenes]|uniref:Disulfide bond formation protein DsbA n=1 Tax=Haloplanus aerogenes TaxID=660522 RepID=A0A3M0DQJ1_9EURY|nr:DsbA family protein [Haloplanus aerogenes]AZH24560.1 disulfide bond formation protein DsbA [Haloplanus aerogenes]RMB23785.1 putative DsbA family dithiol-disulfide isomerase [Haloplanus aerogenes]